MKMDMRMNRRAFLRCAGAGALAFSGLSGLTRDAKAATSNKVLVAVFMRGGWDGLNICVPHGDDNYYSLRPSLAIRPPSSGNAQSALNLDGFFGFHPAMTSLYDLYQQGMVAVLPAVHYSGSSRSHFSGQDMIESAGAPALTSGWLARYLQQASSAPSAKAFSLSDQIPYSLLGLSTPITSFPDLSNLQIAATPVDRPLFADVIANSYREAPNPANPLAGALHGVGRTLLDELSALQAVGQMPADSSAVYPNVNFGRQLRQAAALIKANTGHEIITLNFGGWDTHSNQGAGDSAAPMSRLLTDFSDCINAFFADLGNSASRVLLMTSTEFGRTAAQNGSLGTDHGNASTWFLIGPNVRGGIHTGTGWPGLAKSQLVEERALAHSIDYRNIYAEVLEKHLGATNMAGVLPGFTSRPVGIL